MPRVKAALVGAVVVVGLGVAVGAGAARAALSAAQDLRQAQAGLSAVRDREVDPDAARSELRRAHALVGSADEALGSWPVDVVAAVPVLGRSLDAERAVTDTADEVLTGALVLTDGLGSIRASAGGVDLAALAAVREQLGGPAERGRSALDRLRGTSTRLTPPQVGREVTAASAALGPAVDTLERAQAGLGLAEGLLGGAGPRTLMVALQNNAELRGAGGYVSTFGTGRLQDGRLRLDPLRDVIAVADEPERARRVPAPPEFVEDYGPLSADTTIFRSWNMSPHVPDSALVGARVTGALLGTTPDVVVLVDVPALGALAELGGAAVVLPDGSQVSAEELTDALLVDAYARAGDDNDRQIERRAQLRQAAGTVVTRLLGGDLPAAEVLRTLTRLAEGRHVAVWSARPQEQEVLVDLGVAGSVEAPSGGDLLHVSTNNIGGNKLDVYAERQVSVDVRLSAGRADVTQRLSLRNAAPAGLVPYVAGTQAPGTMVDRVELSLPRSASGVTVSVDGAPRPERPSVGASRARLALRTSTSRGATTVVEVRYALELDTEVYRLRLLPQPLATEATVGISVRPADGLTGPSLVERPEPFDSVREVEVRLPR